MAPDLQRAEEFLGAEIGPHLEGLE
jgi:hypothetical protein